MTYVLDGTPEQAMAAFAEHLRRAHAGGPDAEHEAQMAMVSLVRLSLIHLDDVAELDEELRRLGQHDEQGPVDARAIPRGLPASHWWWRYPDPFK
ncbi:MAG TPA: hypothetical protein VF516_41745 [Kofleriaceae bacterium]